MEEVFPPCAPKGGLVRHGTHDEVQDVFGALRGEGADGRLLDEGDVALLLAWNNMADDEGDLRRDGFLNRGAARLADEQMVRAHELRHLVRPADEISAMWKAGFRQRRVGVLATAGNDAYRDAVEGCEQLERVDGAFLRSAGEEKQVP